MGQTVNALMWQFLFHCLWHSLDEDIMKAAGLFPYTLAVSSFYNLRVLKEGFVLFSPQNHKHVTHMEFFRGLGCGLL